MSKPRSTSAGLVRILSLVKPYRGRFLLACGFLIVASGVGLVYPQIVRVAIDEGLASGDLSQIDRLGMLLLGLFLVQGIFTWLRHYLMSWLGARAVADLRKQVIDRLIRLPLEFMQTHHTGELVGRIAGDVTIVEGAVGSELSMAVRNGAQLVGGLALLFTVDVQLTLWTLLIVPPITLGVMLLGRQIRMRSRNVQDELAQTNARVQEALSGLQTVHVFRQEERESAIYARGVERSFDEAISLAKWRATFISIASVSGFLSIALVVWLGSKRVANADDALSAGDLMAFLLYTSVVAVALASLASLWAALARASGATERLFDLIDTHSALVDPASPLVQAPADGAVTFEEVDFRYAARPETPVLRALNVTIAAGATVAIVGTSGSGKSSMASLIPRLFDVDAGRVLVGGTDVREMPLSGLRGAVAIVAQEPTLLSGTLAENIAYGAPGAAQAEIEAAARAAAAHDFISAFPEGYATLSGERGVQLSGGQRQRIAIARALLMDTPILVLDEATSHLDAESEAAIFANLRQRRRASASANAQTVILIAHRLSTIRDADQILVMHEGALVEEGDHASLMARGGVYARLVELQSHA